MPSNMRRVAVHPIAGLSQAAVGLSSMPVVEVIDDVEIEIAIAIEVEEPGAGAPLVGAARHAGGGRDVA